MSAICKRRQDRSESLLLCSIIQERFFFEINHIKYFVKIKRGQLLRNIPDVSLCFTLIKIFTTKHGFLRILCFFMFYFNHNIYNQTWFLANTILAGNHFIVF